MPAAPVAGRLSLRILLLAVILGAEALLASTFLDGRNLAQKPGLPLLIGMWGAWIVRAIIGFAALFATFAYVRSKPALAGIAQRAAHTPWNRALLAAHFAAIAIFGILSAALYGGAPPLLSNLTAAAWMVAGLASAALVGLAMMPWTLWRKLLDDTGKLWLYAATAAIVACSLGNVSRAFWEPTRRLTFELVRLLLGTAVHDMVVQPAAMRIGTPRFTAIVTPECSGLEGVGLLLAFGVLWLLLFREEIRFPQSLLLLPAGIVVLYLLNAVRITALILIGHAGARDIAAGGFHSQAGWIALCCVAFGICVTANRISWFSARASVGKAPERAIDTATAAYLVPFLVILAAGIVSRAASGRFEWLYSLRFFAALVALWLFRRSYKKIDWRCGWIAPIAGVAVFVLWIALDRWLTASASSVAMPTALAAASVPKRVLWIALRIVTAVVTVPVTEELAFRGFLLRRLISADFESVSPRMFTWVSMIVSSVLFGLLHGKYWLAGTLAGALYAFAARRHGRLGDAVVAHAVTNALLAAYVLVFDQWPLW